MPKFKQITDERMFKVMAYAIETKKATHRKDFCEQIGALPNNLVNIRNGTQSFTISHIRQTCITFNISANYIFGLSNVMLRTEPAKAIDRLRAAVAEMEAELKKKNRAK